MQGHAPHLRVDESANAERSREPTVYLSAHEAAERLKITAATLRRWDALGIFPADREPGSRRRVYLPARVEAFCADRRTFRHAAGERTVFGRARDLRAVTAILKTGSVTVIGPPGVGKTTLAAAIARMTGGVVCHLADVTTAEALLSALALAVGHPMRTPETADVQLESIANAIRAHAVRVLVLDNVDQLIPTGVGLIQRLCDELPSLRLVVTSREPVNLAVERLYRLGSLRVADAAALFEARARALGAHRSMARERSVVRAVVERLDGIPLAIEFAAGLALVHGARGLLRQLESDPSSQRGSARSRHDDVLRRSFALSWSRLTDAERLALRECVVFESGFTPSAAEAVLSAPTDGTTVREVLERLVRKSLVAVRSAIGSSSTSEYRLLATVKMLVPQFEVPALNRDALAARHAASLVARFASGTYDPYVDPTDAHRDDVRRHRADCVSAIEYLRTHSAGDAARLALHVCNVIQSEGPHELHLRLLDIASECVDGLTAVERVGVITARATAIRWTSRYAQAEEYAREAVRFADASGDPRARALAYATLAEVLPWRSLHAEALHHAERAIELASGVGDRGSEALAHVVSSLVYRTRLDAAAAERHALASIELNSQLGSSRGLGSATEAVGWLRFEADDFDAAEALLSRARQTYVETFDRRRECFLLTSLTSVAIARGRDHVALGYLRDAMRSRKLLATLPVAPFMQLNLGIVLLRSEHFDEAAIELDAAIDQLRAREHFDFLAIALSIRAATHAMSGDVDAARSTMVEAERTLPPAAKRGPADLVYLRGVVSCAEARGALAAGDTERAARWLADARARLEAPPAPGLPPHPVSRVLLERALERSASRGSSTRITVAPDGSAFVGTDGVHRDLTKRRALRNILAALVAAHGGAPLGVRDLAAAGWPGERMVGDSASNRVWVALSTLRDMGLSNAIVRVGRAYAIAPHIVLDPRVDRQSHRRARRRDGTQKRRAK